MKFKSAHFLLGLCHAGSAAAIGLGGASVHSNLGQPLHATVEVLAATAETTADCFSLHAGTDRVAPPLRTQLSLEGAGAQTRLHIRTRQSVNDPVVQFVLVADCEARLQRDYVLLLDPPVATGVPGQDTQLAGAEAPPAAATPVSGRQGPGERRAAEASRPSSAVPARVPAARPRPAPTQRAAAKAAPAPRLVLSGKRGGAGIGEPSFALRLDTNLPDLARTRGTVLSATELSDENTALSRKLAYLEAQLTALQRRNAELEIQRRNAPAVAPPPPAKSSPQWPLLMLAAGLLTGGVALLAWRLRRNGTPRSVLGDDTQWAPAAPDEAAAERAPGIESVPPAPVRMAEIARPDEREGTEVKEGILDQAEVFMAHGHANLAIHLLQEHLRQAPAESPVPWLLLLDLLHREGDAAGYAAASTECRRYFNINLSERAQDGDGGQGLEAYPHLLEQLVHVWNTPERDTFFKDLIYDHRGGTRMGFRPAAYRDILLLRAIAQAVSVTEAA